MDSLTKKEIRMLKNRQAADRSRKRKADHIASLETSITSLEEKIKSYQSLISSYNPTFSSQCLFLDNSFQDSSSIHSEICELDSFISLEDNLIPINHSSLYNIEPAVFV